MIKRDRDGLIAGLCITNRALRKNQRHLVCKYLPQTGYLADLRCERYFLDRKGDAQEMDQLAVTYINACAASGIGFLAYVLCTLVVCAAVSPGTRYVEGVGVRAACQAAVFLLREHLLVI